MSTYVLMKLLESAPRRYDRGIAILTLGRMGAVYDRVAAEIQAGQRVLDIGCGSGALALRAARRGATVKGIDVNPEMLEIAAQRVAEAGLSEKIDLAEMGVAELSGEKTLSFDVVASILCFSELSEDEINFTLKEIKRILKPGGVLLLADEVKPRSSFCKLFNGLIRIPLVIITYLISQTTTHALKNLPEKVEQAGFRISALKLSKLQDFAEIRAVKPN